MVNAQTSPPARRLPVQQLAVLSIARFAEPIAMTSVFPYLPEMIESLDVSKDEVARWAGITSSVFALSQAIFAIPWGRASDRYGRKPIILICLTGTMTMTLCWGASRTLAMAVAVRAVQGIFNGSVGVIRTTVAEMVPYKELQPRAFSVMPLVWNVGSIFGPMLGGLLANPKRRLPGTTPGSNAGFLDRFPCILPNLVASLLFLVGITTGLLFLDESLETRKARVDYPRKLGRRIASAFRSFTKSLRIHGRSQDLGEREPLLANPAHAESCAEAAVSRDMKKVAPAPPSILECMTPQTTLNLLCYTLLATHNIAFDVLIPLFMHYPRPPSSSSFPDIRSLLFFSGGYGLDNARIGLLFTIYGLFGMLVQFFIFPPLARRYGVVRCLRICVVAMPIIYIFVPFTALIEDPLTQQIVGSILQNLKGIFSTFSFPCSTILLTNSAPSLRILGTLNGIAVSVSAIGRATGPAIVGLAFTLGVEHGSVVVPWWTLTAIAVLAAVPVFWIVEGDGFGGADDVVEDSDDEEPEYGSDVSVPPDVTANSPIDSAPSGMPVSPLAVPRAVGLAQPSGSINGRTTASLGYVFEENDGPSPAQSRRCSVSRRFSIPIGMSGMSRRYSDNLGHGLGSAGGHI